jgi:hypothetical protein
MNIENRLTCASGDGCAEILESRQQGVHCAFHSPCAQFARQQNHWQKCLHAYDGCDDVVSEHVHPFVWDTHTQIPSFCQDNIKHTRAYS